MQIDRLPGFMVMDADTVVREGWEAVERGDPVCINGRLNRTLVGVASVTPRSLLRSFGRSRLLRPKRD